MWIKNRNIFLNGNKMHLRIINLILLLSYSDCLGAFFTGMYIFSKNLSLGSFERFYQLVQERELIY